MEAKKSFAEASTSRSQDKTVEEMDPSMLIMFLETCMKLPLNNKVVKGLYELINKCASKENSTNEPHIVKKIIKHKEKTGRDMRLTMQIGEYKMDQVILDLGSNENVFPKQTWKRMGIPALQWSPIQLRMENQQKIIPMGRL